MKSFYKGWKRPAYYHLSQASIDWFWDSQWLRYWSSQQGLKQHGKHPSFASVVSLQEQSEVDCKHMEPSIIHSNFQSVFFILRSCYYCGTAEYYPIPNGLSGIGLHHSPWPRTRGQQNHIVPWVIPDQAGSLGLTKCGQSASVTFHHPHLTTERAPIWVKNIFLEVEKWTIGLPTLNTSLIISSSLLWSLYLLSSPWWIVAQALKTFRGSLAQHLCLLLFFIGTPAQTQHRQILPHLHSCDSQRPPPSALLSFIPS